MLLEKMKKKRIRTKKNCNPFECFRLDSLFLLKWKSKVHTTDYKHIYVGRTEHGNVRGLCDFFCFSCDQINLFKVSLWYACFRVLGFWDWIFFAYKIDDSQRDFSQGELLFSRAHPNKHSRTQERRNNLMIHRTDKTGKSLAAHKHSIELYSHTHTQSMNMLYCISI